MKIRADQLTEGQTIRLPMSGFREVVTGTRIVHDYVTVHTTGTGPRSGYQWLRGEPITVLPDGDDGDDGDDD